MVVFSHFNSRGKVPAKVKQQVFEDDVVREAVGLINVDIDC